jgi:hypothetical protein
MEPNSELAYAIEKGSKDMRGEKMRVVDFDAGSR